MTAIEFLTDAQFAALNEKQQLEYLNLIEAQYGGVNPFADSWDFLCKAVWTRDEASGKIRKFPAEKEWRGSRFEYLRYLTVERDVHKRRAYEKSRRMMITWWLVALYLYDILTQSNHLNAVASDKLEKSAYLIGPERMQFIYDLIPPVRDVGVLNMLQTQGLDLAPFVAPVWPGKPEVKFQAKLGMGYKLATCSKTQSSCMAVASGESQMQQYTFSNVLMDEFPRWQWQEESWRNIQPTTQGGGCVDIVCTAELGVFAHDLIYD